jgi:hypothetical protein
MKKVHIKQQKIANMISTQTTIITNNNTQFTHKEIQLLNKGMKYNLRHKNKKWIETLAPRS